MLEAELPGNTRAGHRARRPPRQAVQRPCGGRAEERGAHGALSGEFTSRPHSARGAAYGRVGPWGSEGAGEAPCEQAAPRARERPHAPATPPHGRPRRAGARGPGCGVRAAATYRRGRHLLPGRVGRLSRRGARSPPLPLPPWPRPLGGGPAPRTKLRPLLRGPRPPGSLGRGGAGGSSPSGCPPGHRLLPQHTQSRRGGQATSHPGAAQRAPRALGRSPGRPAQPCLQRHPRRTRCQVTPTALPESQPQYPFLGRPRWAPEPVWSRVGSLGSCAGRRGAGGAARAARQPHGSRCATQTSASLPTTREGKGPWPPQSRGSPPPSQDARGTRQARVLGLNAAYRSITTHTTSSLEVYSEWGPDPIPSATGTVT
ncbi:uncharacterized protein [Vulpes vulpes]|uniref:Collagen alpha-1(I) chain-like n=1 Tax=Vulpes vulpes TaxID=9627 RepID=A0ABM4XJ14_VULVU